LIKGCLNNNAESLYGIYNSLYDKVKNEDFITDKTGCKIVEELAPQITIDLSDPENQGFIDFEARKSPRKYIDQEKDWYLSEDLSIDKVKDVKIWKEISDIDNEINSNYGYLVYSKGNFSQFRHALETLKKDKDSRQAIIVYIRPSIQLEHNDLGGRDFICTIDNHFFIRNNTLIDIVDQRSLDMIYGIFNDLPWFVYVYNNMYKKLIENPDYENLKRGKLIYQPHSAHVYERHFDLLKDIAEGNARQGKQK